MSPELDGLSLFVGFGLGFIACAILTLFRAREGGYRPATRTLSPKPPRGGSGTAPYKKE